MFTFECYILVRCAACPGLFINKVRHNNTVIQIVFLSLYSNQSSTTAKAQNHLTKHMSMFNAVFFQFHNDDMIHLPKKGGIGRGLLKCG